MGIIFKRKAAATIATPSSGKVHFFVDDTGLPKVKDDAGAVSSFTGPAGAQGPSVSTGDKGDVTVLSGNVWRVSAGLRAAGAVGDGTSDDRAAFTSLDALLAAGTGIKVTQGRYRIASNLTITRPLSFENGARLVVPTGVTVTINAPIYAPVDQIFEFAGTGQVVLSAAYNVDRWAEWWGATLGADCSPAFAQCIVSGTRTLLQARDYVISATMVIPAFATVQGVGCYYEGEGTATRVLAASPSITIVQLGSTATPTDLNSAPSSPTVYDVYFTRNQAPNAGTVSALIGWSRFARMERCRVNTSITGYRVTNAVSPFIVDCFSKRDIAIAAGQGADSFIGYHLDGTGALPAAGGNASVWLTRPQTELNVNIADSTGYKINGRFTDTFVTQPETLGTNYGMDIQGDKGAGTSGVGSNANLVIENPVIDQTKTLSIRIRDINKWGAVHILQPYCGPATGDAITASNCDGHVGITTGQMRMNVSTTGKGITFDGCRSPFVQGTHIAECSTQALVLNNVTGGQFEPVIQNATATLSAAVQAVAGVVKCIIKPSVNGDPGKVSIAYQSLAASNDRNAISFAGLADGVVTSSLVLTNNAESNSGFPDLVVASSLKTASAAIVNVEQVAGQLLLPANTLLPGTTIRVRATGQYSQTGTAAVANIQRLRLGPLGTVADPIFIPISTTSNAAASTKQTFTIEFTLTCRAIGTSGQIAGFALFQNAAAVGIANTLTPLLLPNGAAPAANNGLLTLNTTVNNFLSLTAVSGAATSNITYEVAVLFIEKA